MYDIWVALLQTSYQPNNVIDEHFSFNESVNSQGWSEHKNLKLKGEKCGQNLLTNCVVVLFTDELIKKYSSPTTAGKNWFSSVRYSHVLIALKSNQFGIGENSHCTPTNQHAWPNKTTHSSVVHDRWHWVLWQLSVSALFICLFICLFIILFYLVYICVCVLWPNLQLRLFRSWLWSEAILSYSTSKTFLITHVSVCMDHLMQWE